MRAGNDDLRNLGEFQYRFARLESFIAINGYCAANGIVRDEHWETFFMAAIKPGMKASELVKKSKELQKEIKLFRKAGRNWGWIPDENMKNVDPHSLLKRLVRIRHNLFHGNKDFPNEGRDRALVLEGLELLRALAADLHEYSKLL